MRFLLDRNVQTQIWWRGMIGWKLLLDLQFGVVSDHFFTVVIFLMLHTGRLWICNAIKSYKQYGGICLVNLIEKDQWKRIHVGWQNYLEISYLYTAILCTMHMAFTYVLWFLNHDFQCFLVSDCSICIIFLFLNSPKIDTHLVY